MYIGKKRYDKRLFSIRGVFFWIYFLVLIGIFVYLVLKGFFCFRGLYYFNDYYIKLYCRVGFYIVGIFCGYFLYKIDCKLKINKVIFNNVKEFVCK